MTLKEEGEDISITKQGVKNLEDSEKNGTISLNSLRRYASSVGYKLEYRFVIK